MHRSVSAGIRGACVEPIKMIAAYVGFGDPERMRRAFIRRFGKPPQALRRAARGRDAAEQQAEKSDASVDGAPSPAVSETAS
jgi:AraC-like DNA-binding protein